MLSYWVLSFPAHVSLAHVPKVLAVVKETSQRTKISGHFDKLRDWMTEFERGRKNGAQLL